MVGSPPKATFLKAIKNNHYIGWSGLDDPALVDKHLAKKSKATVRHMTPPHDSQGYPIYNSKTKPKTNHRQQRTTTAATKTAIRPQTPSRYILPQQRRNQKYYRHRLTRPIPCYIEMCTQIHLHHVRLRFQPHQCNIPIKSRKSHNLVEAFKLCHKDFSAVGFTTPVILRLNNEISRDLITHHRTGLRLTNSAHRKPPFKPR